MDNSNKISASVSPEQSPHALSLHARLQSLLHGSLHLGSGRYAVIQSSADSSGSGEVQGISTSLDGQEDPRSSGTLRYWWNVKMRTQHSRLMTLVNTNITHILHVK